MDDNGSSRKPQKPNPGESQKEYKGVSSSSIRRPIGTMAIASVVIVLGFFFLDRLAVDLLPEINYPQIRVTVNYPGTAPEVMEEQITRVLETNLASTENLISLESRASEGRTNVNLIFEYGTDIDLAIQDASRNMELARTQMPPDIEPPRLYKFDPAQDPVYEAGFTSDTRSPLEVRDWLENNLTPQLLSIYGVGGVEVAGGQIREMQVILDQERLRSYNLTLNDVEEAIEGENIDIAAGQVTSETFDVMAKTDGRFESAGDIENVMLSIPNSNRRIKLSEVANVKDTHQFQRIFARMNGENATQLSVTKLPDANTVQVVDNVNSELERLEASGFIPDDIEFESTRDASFFIRSSIDSVSTAAILGGTLAMMVVLLFLGSLRKSFVIGLSIPIAIMATFSMMGMGGLTLNIMSLGGLALGVGLLLDNSIVMLENIFRHKDNLGKESDPSAHEGSKEVTSAIIAATLTNLAAVTPFLLITGLAAMIFQELILTISFAIVASLAVALTLVPMLSALFTKVKYRSGLETSRFHTGFNRGLKWFTEKYKNAARFTLKLRYGVVALGFALLAVVWVLSDDLGNEFLPPVDDGNVSVWMGLPPGAPPDKTNEAALKVEEVIESMPHIENVFSITGGHLSGGILNERPGTARFAIQLSPASQRDMSGEQWSEQMQSRLDEMEIPGARLNASPPSIDGIRTNLAGADVSIGVVGDDIDVLDGIGRELVNKLDDIEGLNNVEIARDDRSPLMNIEVDRERASSYDLNVSEVGNAVRAAVDGTVPTRFSTTGAEYDVRVMFPRDQVRHNEDLGDINIFRHDGNPVRLRDVASFTLGDGPAHIERENQVRILRVNGEVNTRVSDVGTVNDEIRERLVGYDMPEQYNLIYGGEEEVIQETQRNLALVTLLAIFMVFVVMAVQYERLANPIVILTAVPLSLIGVGALLLLTGTNLSAPVMLGVILLVGIVVNNAILLVEYIEIGRKEGLSPMEAAVEAGGIRLRPIMMTTLTTVFGMLPLAIGIGEGAELMQPLAIAVVGGLLISTLLTLFVVPSLYLIISGAADKIKYWLTGIDPQDQMGYATEGVNGHPRQETPVEEGSEQVQSRKEGQEEK